MKCPYCSYLESKVIDSRPAEEGTYDREKLTRGILRACEKRNISAEQIISIVNQVESLIDSSYDGEIPSKVIGEYTMQVLKDIDEVAYVRFASVYRSFKDINTFMEELSKILSEK